jgi:hypothetical protein
MALKRFALNRINGVGLKLTVMVFKGLEFKFDLMALKGSYKI